MPADTAPAQKTLVSGLSGRYALALYELAEEAGQLETVESELSALSALLNESAELRQIAISKAISRDQAKAAMAKLAAEMKLSGLLGNFLGVLATNRRLGALARIIADFGKLLSARRGEMRAEVRSARPLTDEQLAALSARLKTLAGQEVTLESALDETLIGGLVVRLGSRMIDGSIASRLSRLERAMKGI